MSVNKEFEYFFEFIHKKSVEENQNFKKHKNTCESDFAGAFFVAEMVGFEPTPRLPGLPHFECGPLNLLGTSPSLHGFGTLLKGA